MPLRAHHRPGKHRIPALKPTRFISNAPAILDRLSLHCRGVQLTNLCLVLAVRVPRRSTHQFSAKAIQLGAEKQRRRKVVRIPPAVSATVAQGRAACACSRLCAPGSHIRRGSTLESPQSQ